MFFTVEWIERQTAAIRLQAAAKASSVAVIWNACSGVGSSLQTMVRTVFMSGHDITEGFTSKGRAAIPPLGLKPRGFLAAFSVNRLVNWVTLP